MIKYLSSCNHAQMFFSTGLWFFEKHQKRAFPITERRRFPHNFCNWTLLFKDFVILTFTRCLRAGCCATAVFLTKDIKPLDSSLPTSLRHDVRINVNILSWLSCVQWFAILGSSARWPINPLRFRKGFMCFLLSTTSQVRVPATRMSLIIALQSSKPRTSLPAQQQFELFAEVHLLEDAAVTCTCQPGPQRFCPRCSLHLQGELWLYTTWIQL